MWPFLLFIKIENAFVLMQMSLVNMLPWGNKGQKWLNFHTTRWRVRTATKMSTYPGSLLILSKRFLAYQCFSHVRAYPNVLVIISKEEISHNENRNCWNVPRQWLVVNVHSHDYFLPPRGLRQMQPLHFRSTFSSGENEIILRVHILNLDGMKTASDVHKLTIGEKKLSGSCWINVNSSAISFSQIYA